MLHGGDGDATEDAGYDRLQTRRRRRCRPHGLGTKHLHFRGPGGNPRGLNYSEGDA